MPAEDLLKRLFHAFKERDDALFFRTAESIIADELAANHHTAANELRKVLGSRSEFFKRSEERKLTLLPKGLRKDEDLLHLSDSSVDQSRIVLAPTARHKIERLLEEHRKRTSLSKFGYKPKTKILFWGPPGCGKTYTSRFVAHELGLAIGILRLSATISSFLGDTASHLQRVFDFANSRPMVLLLDEFDAIGKTRTDARDVGELKRVVNGLLQAIDTLNFDRSIVIAASNHQDLLDEALWRRFDDVIHFPFPEKVDREAQLKLLLNGVNFTGSISRIAQLMNALSFADIERITIEAVKTVVLSGREQLAEADILDQLKSHRETIATARTPNKPKK
jgi:SpoVK/Ycf46/Vps4 family AAA+-type ATPase